MKLEDLKENKGQWVEMDKMIKKFWSHYEPNMSDDDIRTLAAEEWSDKFTDEQIDSGEFDQFIDYAASVYHKG